MFLSSATLSQSTVLASQPIQNTPIVQAASASVLLSTDASTSDQSGSGSLKQYVKNYYADTPILASIAGCESHYHQFAKSGDVIHGLIDPEDIGVMQINEHYNGETAKNLGYDIYSLDGNLAFAKWLYDHKGVQPWMSSSACWANQ